MSDIVAKVNASIKAGDWVVADLVTAVREIERLRAALREIADFDTYEDISNEECMRDIARAALEIR